MNKLLRLAKPAKPQETIAELLKLLERHPQIQELFMRFGVPLAHLHNISIQIKNLDVSAKAKDGAIYLNKTLVEDGDLVGDLHYVVHELVHILQQISGEADDYGDLDHFDYIDMPTEVEAFREQIRFIRDYKGHDEAQRYLDELLDFHELKGSERTKKARELGGEA